MSIEANPARKRSDAERNREKILSAARSVLIDTTGHIETTGQEVSMAEIARQAGVGMATLYRNFAGRQELLEALFTEAVTTVCAAATAHADGAAGPGLTSWLLCFADFLGSKHRLAAELLRHTDASDPVFGGSRERVLAAGRPLLIRAQAAGEARNDISIEQVLDMIIAIKTITHDTEYAEPILRAALAGLRIVD